MVCPKPDGQRAVEVCRYSIFGKDEICPGPTSRMALCHGRVFQNLPVFQIDKRVFSRDVIQSVPLLLNLVEFRIPCPNNPGLFRRFP